MTFTTDENRCARCRRKYDAGCECCWKCGWNVGSEECICTDDEIPEKHCGRGCEACDCCENCPCGCEACNRPFRCCDSCGACACAPELRDDCPVEVEKWAFEAEVDSLIAEFEDYQAQWQLSPAQAQARLFSEPEMSHRTGGTGFL